MPIGIASPKGANAGLFMIPEDLWQGSGHLGLLGICPMKDYLIFRDRYMKGPSVI